MLSEKPSTCITASVAISDTGMAIVGMSVVRQLCRKTNTTSDHEDQRFAQRDQHVVHGRRRRNASCRNAWRRRCPWGNAATVSASRPGRVFCRSSALEPGIWNTPSTTVGSSPKKAVDEYCRAPSSMRATSRRRTTVPAAGSARSTISPNCSGIAEAPERVDLHFESRAGRRRRLADLAGRDLHVLFGQRVLHVDGGDAEIGEPVGIEPDAHRIAPLAEDLDVAHAGQALQRIDDLQT